VLALIVALFWLAILVPWAVVKFRNSRSERSIDTFQAEHEVLSRQEYSVVPARRLDDAYLYEEHSYEPEHEAARSRPHLTVVHDDDTYSTLESRLTWDEWERDYDYEQPPTISTPTTVPHARNRYAAYASSPTPQGPYATSAQHVLTDGYVDQPLGASMRVRRNRIFVSLGLSAMVTTGLNFLIGLSVLQYLAILSWVGLVFYMAAALFAVSQGYLEVSSLVGRRSKALAPTYDDASFEKVAYYEEEASYEDDVYEEAANNDEWRREPRRYALG
jgi:hypothetical protein